MALTKEAKDKIIGEFKQSDSDTGSPDVQIAILSNRIQYLSEHFKTHKKDNHSKRSLIGMVSRRRKLLDYLKRKEFDRYKSVIEALGIRK
ncbi:MAG: 30S ribosomal protein S15 [Nitrospinota bacterium]